MPGREGMMAKRISKKERWRKTTEIWWFTSYHQIREAIENIIDVVDIEDMDDDLDNCLRGYGRTSISSKRWRVRTRYAPSQKTKGHLEQCRFSTRDWLPVRIDSYFRV
jgi:hypothetical protein